MTFEEARAQFPVLERVAYLNAGTFGPLARATVEAQEAQALRELAEGRRGKPYFDELLALREEVRGRLAALVGAPAEAVALTTSTTDGAAVVLAGLGLGPEDEVVTTAEEHFGLLGALRSSPARVVVAPADPELIVAAVTPRTRLLALSQVLWTTGRELPVRELRAATGLPVLVDGAQSVGAIRVDAAGLDFLTISGQKWLCGPDATGGLVVADPERLRMARPTIFGRTAHEPNGAFTPRDGAARFDTGAQPLPSLRGLLAALDAMPDWAYDGAAGAADRCRERLARRFPVEHGDATLVSFRPEGDAAETALRLGEADVVIRDIPGSGLLRASCGWWTSDGDLDRLLEAL
ncbi:MAG TPA: aminotransferase class V-fold PLP-dependent enzyme [Gaiellaceae bacterium]|jgi:L-cysteine/cystine lyase|nr:aminotransferase class V-fold PLP-dependent enzyme [Gaiellaceae bacterium]